MNHIPPLIGSDSVPFSVGIIMTNFKTAKITSMEIIHLKAHLYQTDHMLKTKNYSLYCFINHPQIRKTEEQHGNTMTFTFYGINYQY